MVTGHWWDVPWRGERGQHGPPLLSRPAPLSHGHRSSGQRGQLFDGEKQKALKRGRRKHVLLRGAVAATLSADFARHKSPAVLTWPPPLFPVSSTFPLTQYASGTSKYFTVTQ